MSYTRFGGALGVGKDLSLSTQLWVNYRLETIDATVPTIASQERGYETEPIEFDIIPGRSVLSTLRGSVQHDTRDHPFLPTRGWLVNVTADVSLFPATRDYDYQRLEFSAARWWKLPWKQHVVKLELFGGAIAGDAPFFEQFYVGDFTDFLPDRVLDLNFDRRPPPNFLGTDIVEVRYGKYAFRLGGEYRVPLYRGRRSIYGIDFFGSAGRLRRGRRPHHHRSAHGLLRLRARPDRPHRQPRVSHGHERGRLRLRFLQRARVHPGARRGSRRQ